MKRLKLAVAGLFAAALVSTAAYAAGMFPGFPIVGGASYCNGYATGTSGQVCIQQVPAGPNLTGAELMPADTQLSQGQSPQTVLIPSKVLGGGALNYQAPLTGASITVGANDGKLILKPAGTIATLTVTLPPASALTDQQILQISSTQTVTALTLTPGSGTTINNTPTAITPSTTGSFGYQFIYRAASAEWFRID